MNRGNIRPFTDHSLGWSQGFNKLGAFVAEHENGNVFSLTQVFQNREIWGINASLIDKKDCMGWAKSDFGFFPCIRLENIFIQSLNFYLIFCKDFLKLPLPLKFKAGATNVEGYKMAGPNNWHFPGLQNFGGRAVNEHLIHEGEIKDFDNDPRGILLPFFQKIWEECGLERPDLEQ